MDIKNLLWDNDSQSVRGSFVNLLITVAILALITVGAFNSDVAARLEKLGVLIIGFFSMSMGIWAIRKTVAESSGTKGPT